MSLEATIKDAIERSAPVALDDRAATHMANAVRRAIDESLAPDEQLAAALWDELAEIGWCDGRGGAEYERFVESEYGVHHFAGIVRRLQGITNVPVVKTQSPCK